MSSKKQFPNIIICGTPGMSSFFHFFLSLFYFCLCAIGVGTSSLCQGLCSSNKSLKYININDLAKKNACELKVLQFVKLNLGEGIEKKQDNFVDEVAKMTSTGNN